MLSAGAAALTNIGLLGALVATYVQNMRLIRSYFTGGLVLVASFFHDTEHSNSNLLVKIVCGWA